MDGLGLALLLIAGPGGDRAIGPQEAGLPPLFANCGSMVTPMAFTETRGSMARDPRSDARLRPAQPGRTLPDRAARPCFHLASA
jgi:hypothetical protein